MSGKVFSQRLGPWFPVECICTDFKIAYLSPPFHFWSLKVVPWWAVRYLCIQTYVDTNGVRRMHLWKAQVNTLSGFPSAVCLTLHHCTTEIRCLYNTSCQSTFKHLSLVILHNWQPICTLTDVKHLSWATSDYTQTKIVLDVQLTCQVLSIKLILTFKYFVEEILTSDVW